MDKKLRKYSSIITKKEIEKEVKIDQRSLKTTEDRVKSKKKRLKNHERNC